MLFKRIGLGLGDLVDLRQMFADETDQASIGVGVSFPLAISAGVLARYRGERLVALAFAAMALLLAVVSTSKIFVLMFALFLVPVHQRIDVLPLRRTLLLGMLLLIAFSLLHVVLGKVEEEQGKGLITSIIDILTTYSLFGLGGFVTFMAGDADFPHNAVWKPIADLLPGLIDVPDRAILPWAKIGQQYGNVYSAFSYWVDGFGLLGTFAFAAMLGFASRRIFAQRGLGYVIIQRLLLFALTMIFFGDWFLSALSMWVGFIAAAVLVTIVEPGPASARDRLPRARSVPA